MISLNTYNTTAVNQSSYMYECCTHIQLQQTKPDILWARRSVAHM